MVMATAQQPTAGGAGAALVWDGFTAQEGGMNDGMAAQRLPPAQCALLINATVRGDYVKQRPGFANLMTVLAALPGAHQHTSFYRTDNGQVFVIVVAGGRFFRVDPVALDVLEITIPGDANPSIIAQGWSVQGECFWIYNDGQSAPFIWNGVTARRAGPREIQPGTAIAYVQGRLWYALPDGVAFRATDLVGNTDSGTPAYNYRDSILRETENTYLNEGGDFAVPGAAGPIRAMLATAILDTSQGQGPLQVFCENAGFSVNTPVDRTIWKLVQYPIQTQSLVGVGFSGQQNTLNVNGDIFGRSPDGIRSFIIARRDFRDWGNTPQSFEVSGVLAFDQPDLLTRGSAAVFDNRLLMTVSPVYTDAGVYHRGLVVMDLSPISSIKSNGTPNYDGVWTGLNILATVQTPIGVFFTVLEADGSLALWQLTRDALFDDGDGRVAWSIVPRQLFRETGLDGTPGRTLKRLETAELEYDSLTGAVTFALSWAPDSFPCLTPWQTWDECNVSCAPVPGCVPALNFQPSYQPRRRLPSPPDVCATGAARPLANFYTLRVKLNVTGPARLLGVRFGAIPQREPVWEAECAAAVCSPLQCCGIYLFDYAAKGSDGPYYGSGSGGGGGGP